MGMYTELVLSCALKSGLPTDVESVLQHLFSDGPAPIELPKHPFFSCTRWDCVGRMSSFYFHPESYAYIHKSSFGGGSYLFTRFDLKNYDSEIDMFVEWLTPYMANIDGKYLGYKRYEEDERPTLLFYPNRWEAV